MNELWEIHEDVLKKVIAREVSEGGGGGALKSTRSCWQERWLGKQPGGS